MCVCGGGGGGGGGARDHLVPGPVGELFLQSKFFLNTHIQN